MVRSFRIIHLLLSLTRSSAVADKPRDIRCKCNDVADLLKTRTTHMCYHTECGPSRSNRVRISSGELAKLGSARAITPRDGGRRPPKNKPLPICDITPKRSFCIKGCRHKYRRTTAIEERWSSTGLGRGRG